MSTLDDYRHAMDLVAEVERGPLSKFSAETRASADLIRAVDNYHRETQRRAAWVQGENTELKAKLIKYELDYRAAATEFRVPLPELDTDAAKLMLDARNARRRAADLETENLRLLAEIDEWKDASGLSKGGDPEAVTPEDLREYREDFERKINHFTFVSMSEGRAPDVGEVVVAYCKAFGLNGLCNEECGCSLDDLAPCGEMNAECVLGKQVPAPEGSEFDFMIVPASQEGAPEDE